MNRLRTYTKQKGKLILLAWIDRRCKKCQRFLSKERHKYCPKCSHKAILENKRNRYWNNLELREYMKLRARFYKYPDRFNIGDII
jgi:Zn finger protein HypA/HybF involved in hydrogenase expression